MNKKIFLDFDGVFFNTVKEAYAVTMISTGKYNSINDLDFESNHYKNFLKYRYLVGPAWNYKYILQVLESEKIESIEEKYNRILNTVKELDYYSFEELFFKTRESLKKTDFINWLKLNEPYPFLSIIKDFILSYKDDFVIITTKDKSTVLKLLERENIVLEENKIYDNEDFNIYKNKSTIIKQIIEKEKIEKSLFIDDSKKHLSRCKEIEGLSLMQANWGYISASDNDCFSDKEIINKITQILGCN